MACPDFNWQHPPVLEIWRKNQNSDGDSTVMLESFSTKETVKIFTGALSCNTVSYDFKLY